MSLSERRTAVPPDEPGRQGPAPGRGVGFVEFVDPDNVRWRVTEREARRTPGARGEWCLVFACADSWRRVWDYPPGWRDLPVADFVVLSRAR